MDRQRAERFQDLIVWQKSQELFGLTSQMRRAAVSVAANIAEGVFKKGRPDKARLMNISQGSLEELRYYFILSRDIGYVDSKDQWHDLDEVARLLGAYVRALVARPSS